MIYARGQKQDYDNWASLGNKGWAWEDIRPYFLKHEHLDDPDSLANKQSSLEKAHHGFEGPIHTSFPSFRYEIEERWVEACQTALNDRGHLPDDGWSGEHRGVFSALTTVDHGSAKGTRSYSASGYLEPALKRDNLKVITNAHAARAVLSQDSGLVKVTGVEFLHKGKLYVAEAVREVVICAGAFLSPQLLELSGIGDPSILARAGVQTIVKNEEVGANFQDHILTGISYTLGPNTESREILQHEGIKEKAMDQYSKSQTGPLSTSSSNTGFIPYKNIASEDEIKTVTDLIASCDKEVSDQTRLETNRFANPETAGIHLFAGNFSFDQPGDEKLESKGPSFGMGVSLELPFSRGSVHITSSSPLEQPAIDQGYLSHPADIAMLCTTMRYADKCFQMPCLADKVIERRHPAPAYDLQDQAQLEDYIRGHSQTEHHPMGTVAMGKVVDERLKVFGVQGLRVCDASVFPGNISGNLVGTVYAVAEKGADLIKQDWS